MSESAASAVLPSPKNENASACASSPDAAPAWRTVCRLADVVPNTGVAAVIGGRQVAIFRIGGGDLVYAIGNRDPFTGANVLSRGLLGDKRGVVKVSSPLHKQSFALESGECLDDPAVKVPVYPARVRDEVVEIAI
jgi:nitrite reductase (NADH) small subunit